MHLISRLESFVNQMKEKKNKKQEKSTNTPLPTKPIRTIQPALAPSEDEQNEHLTFLFLPLPPFLCVLRYNQWERMTRKKLACANEKNEWEKYAVDGIKGGGQIVLKREGLWVDGGIVMAM